MVGVCTALDWIARAFEGGQVRTIAGSCACPSSRLWTGQIIPINAHHTRKTDREGIVKIRDARRGRAKRHAEDDGFESHSPPHVR